MTTNPQDKSAFELDEDGCGIEFDDFVTAVYMLICLRGTLAVRQVGEIFNVTDDVVREAVDEAYYLFVTGPSDDPTKQMIEVDGE